LNIASTALHCFFFALSEQYRKSFAEVLILYNTDNQCFMVHIQTHNVAY